MLRSIVLKTIAIIKKKREANRFFSHQKNTFNKDAHAIRSANRLGFTIDESVIYRFPQNNPHKYISEFERYLLRQHLSEKGILLDNKIVFYHLIRPYAPVNLIYGYKSGNSDFVWMENRFDNPLDLIVKAGKICYKMIASGCGEGFHVLEYRNDHFFIDRNPSSQDSILKLLASKNYFLETYCHQSDFENAIFAGAVNTIRIITLTDADGKDRIVCSLHRFGSSADAIVDNASAGGLFSMIDTKTGRLDAAISYAALNSADEKSVQFPVHPVTGVQIEGVIIPHWDTITDKVLSLHRQLRFCGLSFIAWDIAHTNNGFIIVEGNLTSSVDLLQANGGLRDGYLGNYYRRMGIID